MPLEVYFNPTHCSDSCVGGECWDYDLDEWERDIVAAINLWNTAGGSNARFRYMGRDPTKTPGNVGMSGVVVHCTVEMWLGECGGLARAGAQLAGHGVNFTVYAERCAPYEVRRWHTGWSEAADFDEDWLSVYSTALHELGHILGFEHPTGTAGPACDSIMGSNSGVRHAQWLWPEDIEALRHDPVHGYGVRSTSTVRHLRTGNGGASWSSEVDMPDATNLPPAVAFGRFTSPISYCASPPCDGYMVAWTSSAAGSVDTIRYRHTNGVTWSPVFPTTWPTYLPPAVAYGSNRWLLLYTPRDDASATPATSYVLKYRVSRDGWLWTGALDVGVRTAGRVGIDWDEREDVFRLVFTDFDYDDSTDGCVCVLNGHPTGLSGIAWESAPSCLGCAATSRSIGGGPAICCDNAPFCTLFWSDATGLRRLWRAFAHEPSWGGWKLQGGMQDGPPEVQATTEPLGCTMDFGAGELRLLGAMRELAPGAPSVETRLSTFEQICPHPHCETKDFQLLSQESTTGASMEYGPQWSESVIYFAR